MSQQKKWYNYLVWNEMRLTWSMLSPEKKKEIIDSGADVPDDMKKDVQ